MLRWSLSRKSRCHRARRPFELKIARKRASDFQREFRFYLERNTAPGSFTGTKKVSRTEKVSLVYTMVLDSGACERAGESLRGQDAPSV